MTVKGAWIENLASMEIPYQNFTEKVRKLHCSTLYRIVSFLCWINYHCSNLFERASPFVGQSVKRVGEIKQHNVLRIPCS